MSFQNFVHFLSISIFQIKYIEKRRGHCNRLKVQADEPEVRTNNGTVDSQIPSQILTSSDRSQLRIYGDADTAYNRLQVSRENRYNVRHVLFPFSSRRNFFSVGLCQVVFVAALAVQMSSTAVTRKLFYWCVPLAL